MSGRAALGEMRTLVTVQQRTDTDDGSGGQTQVWSTYTTLWARVRTDKGWKQTIGDQRTEMDEEIITAQYKSGITSAMRLTYGGVAYVILEINNIDLRKFQMDIKIRKGEPA